MSPELRAELEAKHAARTAAKSGKKRKAKKSKRKAGKRRTAKKANCGIRNMKELTVRLALKKHGKPTVKAFKLT
jgi:hypothetical protein